MSHSTKSTIVAAMNQRCVACVFGTRPEAIKMAPVVRALRRELNVTTRVVITAQHREMLDQVLDTFDIRADVDLDLMTPGQSLAQLSSRLFDALGACWREQRPDAVLVHGDTTSTMVAALTAFYEQVPVGHVEAGLRTRQIYAPFPEEVNRRVVGSVATWHFAPTTGARDNLLAESVDPHTIYVTGNTVVDALHAARGRLAGLTSRLIEDIVVAERARTGEAFAARLRDPAVRLVLVTGHRRENFGDAMREVFGALRRVALGEPETLFVYPVHLNPNVLAPALELLADVPNVRLTTPLSYLPFLWLIERAHVVITDSGGIQEECSVLGKPTLVTRAVTERPEVLDGGTARLVGTDGTALAALTHQLLHDPAFYASMSVPQHRFGDGTAGAQIASVLARDSRLGRVSP